MLNFSFTFVITIINITILFLILRAVLFKPVTKFMADRAKRVQDAIEQSEKDKDSARALLLKYEEQLKNVRGEAEQIIRNAQVSARQEADRISAEGKSAAAAALANAQKQIEAEQREALSNFRQSAAGLITAASGRLLDRELKDEDNRHYAEMLLESLKDDPIPGGESRAAGSGAGN